MSANALIVTGNSSGRVKPVVNNIDSNFIKKTEQRRIIIKNPKSDHKPES